jgi:intraflagellar transport protein 56
MNDSWKDPEIVITPLIVDNAPFQREYLGLAQKYYTQVGQSQEEHDSVFGRLCMASAHFLNKNFQGCVMYLNSVRTHYYNDDTFNYNYGQVRMNEIR